MTAERVMGGLVIGFLAVLVVGAAMWPLAHRMFPEIGATKVGPRAFPFTVHVGRDAVAFTNGRGTPWACRAEVGFPHVNGSYVVTFSLAPNQTLEVPYLDFRSTRADMPFSVSAVRRAARGAGSLECSEPSGVSHWSAW